MNGLQASVPFVIPPDTGSRVTFAHERLHACVTVGGREVMISVLDCTSDIVIASSVSVNVVSCVDVSSAEGEFVRVNVRDTFGEDVTVKVDVWFWEGIFVSVFVDVSDLATCAVKVRVGTVGVRVRCGGISSVMDVDGEAFEQPMAVPNPGSEEAKHNSRFAASHAVNDRVLYPQSSTNR